MDSETYKWIEAKVGRLCCEKIERSLINTHLMEHNQEKELNDVYYSIKYTRDYYLLKDEILSGTGDFRFKELRDTRDRKIIHDSEMGKKSNGENILVIELTLFVMNVQAIVNGYMKIINIILVTLISLWNGKEE